MTYTWELPQCEGCKLYACCQGLDHCRTPIYDKDGTFKGYEPGCTAYEVRE